MIQGSGEATRDKELQRSQQQTQSSTQLPEHNQVGNSSSELIQQPIVISQVTAATVQAYSQRIALAQTVPTTVNVIATPLTTTGVGGASGTGNATYQHYLIPGVSLGGQVQNIAIPAQVAVSVQQGSLRATGGTQAIVTTAAPTYTINPQQDLARILAATNQNYAVRPTHLCSSGITTSSEQVHTFDVPSGLSATVRNIQFQKVTGSGCTVLTNIPVTTSTMTQRNVIGGVRPDNVAIHISPSPVSSLSQQSQPAIVLDTVTSPEFLHTDVTKVHSYSLASATPTVSCCTGNVYQQVGGIASVPASLIQQKSLVTLPGHKSSSVSQNRTVGTNINVSSSVSPSSTAGIVQSSVNSLNNSFNTSVISSNTLNMPLASSDMSPLHSPRPKRIKLEEKPPADEETGSMRKRICDYRNNEIKTIKEKYQEHLAELFFLQSGGNIMDYLSWRRRPVPQLLAFLKANALESDGEEEAVPDVKPPVSVSSLQITSVVTTSQIKQSGSATEPGSKSTLQNLNTTSSSHSVSSRPAVTSPSRSQPGTGIPTTPKPPKSSPSAVLPANRLHTRQHYISAVYDSAIGSQEEIVERAKQEAYVMQRISELRKDGLWSAKRLPKVQEPPRAKAHWDYLLEEMVWLATDFAQERKWKKAAAKKCSRMILKYHQEREMKAERAEREEYLRLRKIASQVAKEIKQFWTNIEKLVEFKQQTRLEEKRKKALDLHLNFIVDQTEKYSSWLTQGMNKNTLEDTPASSVNEIATSVDGSEATLEDKDFEPDTSGTDDEETIEKEEAHGIDEDEQSKEIEMLHQESELPIEELIKSLPSDILEKPASPLSIDHQESNDEDTGNYLSEDETEFSRNVKHLGENVDNKDEEYYMSNEDEDDDETTIQEQERKETKEEYDDELKELQELGDIPLEELLERYAGAYTSDNEVSVSECSCSNEEEGSSDGDDYNDSLKIESVRASDEEDIDDEEEEEEEGEEFGTDDESEVVDVGMEFLINPERVHHPSKIEEETNDNKVKGPSQEITDIAAAAESFQPKGNTLSTTQVCTKIPFLLKHPLREYQHIGLDWLVAMHDRKLNGILADEMGLGKTIQTIALLAHLACEKGIWGPHLIVVPTSVMLNWEMEFKKWCPAFKIITYYGSQKERRKKREGWTKPNAFHVCITSYKLVIQDHYSFRRKKWKYFILDEAQHIKNFKSQRWQMLLNFQSSRRLLLTGTPLQNSLMELWSLMHFLMPNVFQSHREFKEWFANPVTGMIEGSHEYSESLIKRLHKVLRPFLLRRLKCEVEKQLPKKYEHVIMCRLSKRQRYLYDDFMSQTKTRETLSTGNFMSVINILMQLRKVCNHPNLFESRPTVSPFMMEGITYSTASLAKKAFEYDPFKHVNLWALNLLIVDLELHLTAFAAHRIKKFQTSARFIEDINNQPEPPPRCPPGKLRLHVKAPSQTNGSSNTSGNSPKPATIIRASAAPVINKSTNLVQPQIQTQQQRIVVVSGPNSAPSSRATSPIAAVGPTNNQPVNQQSTEYTLQLIQQPATGGFSVAQLTPVSVGSQMVTTTPITVQIQQTGQGGARLAMPLGIGRLVQTATGQHILLTPATSVANINSEAVVPRQPHQPVTTIAGNVSASVVVQVPSITASSVYSPTNKVNICSTQPALTNTVSSGLSRGFGSNISGISTTKPIVRVAPLNMSTVNSNLTGTTVYNAKTSQSPTVHIASKPVTRSDNQLQSAQKMDFKKSDNRNSIFYIESLTEKRIQTRKEKLKKIGYINTRRCAARPLYGDDLVKAVTVINDIRPCSKSIPWKGMGYVHCYNAPFAHQNSCNYWFYTSVLASLIHTPDTYLQELSDIISRYVFLVPDVTAPQITLHMSHPSPSALNEERLTAQLLHQELSPRCSLLHPITSNMRTQFPELRLIQYDCGKLQTLDKLLWQLKSEGHRVLIFTQMTRMLDVFEQFLNHHGHTYLRLDGTTKVDQRQALMERFNADRRIFCFILSTRSGGIGVNLTGADTVIFYDSDWNPTMDAQAQDRCHRIGQTRDVHIYRLISERTVEENILKKANQKRLLGDLAIEGGNFTTAFFKQNTLRDLFGIEISVEPELKKDNDSNQKSEFDTEEKPSDFEKLAQTQFEQALCMAEEDLDVQAAKTARAEAAAELAEFDESIPFDADSRDNEEKSQAEEELDKLMEQLSPVEKYAMQFLESLQEPFSLEQLKQAEEEIEAQKKDWELGRLKALKEEEERRAATLEDDEEPLLTYTREDAYSQLWAPPTPPQEENDIYIDYSMGFLYEHTTMPESQLPPVYIKKETKRLKVDPAVTVATTRKQKVRKEETVHIPRSLFDRPSAAILKMRREAKLQKFKGVTFSTTLSKPLGLGIGGVKQTPIIVNKPTVDTDQDSPEWLIHEDWAILQIIQTLQDLPLTLTVLSPAHIPNWDLVADVVNSVSRTYRSAKQCKSRYEKVIVPREEGKILYDTNPKKQKKSKGIYKTKNNRPMRTSQLFIQDNNGSFTSLYNSRFEIIKTVTNKRNPTTSHNVGSTSPVKAPKNLAILEDAGINHDQPLTPVQVAAIRAERIAREKNKSQTSAATASEQQMAQRQQSQPVTVAGQVSSTAGLIQHQAAQAVIASLSQAQQIQAMQVKSGLQPGTVTTVSLAKSLASGIVVNTAASSNATTFATITKTLGQPVTNAVAAAQGTIPPATVTALGSTQLRAQRPATTVASSNVTTTLSVQEMVAAAAAAGQMRALTTTTTVTGVVSGTAPAVVSVAGLTSTQLQPSQRLPSSGLALPGAVNAGTTTNQTASQASLAQRSLSQSQLHIYRQSQQLLKQQRIQEQQLKQQQQQQQQLKRLQVSTQQQQQQVTSQAISGKVAVSVNSPLAASVAAVAAAAAAQQRAAQQQAAVKTRAMTEVEMTQLIKRQQQLQQQKQAAAAAAQLTTQILAQAQIQQQQQQQQQQVQQSIAGAVQPMATLVKTVNAPQTSVGLPAVTMAGVNINVSLPQAKTTTTAGKGTATVTPHQIRQIQLQQQLFNQRKAHLQQQQKVASLTQVAKVVAATPSLTTGMQTLRAVPDTGSIKTQLVHAEVGANNSSATTTAILKGAPAVVISGQPQAAILQQLSPATTALTPQQAVTLAVRAGVSPSTSTQPQGQPQVQIQFQQATPNVLQQSQTPEQAASPVSTISLSQPSGQSQTQAGGGTNPVSSTAQVVQAAIQAAKQQQQQQQQRASPYTMRLRNPPK